MNVTGYRLLATAMTVVFGAAKAVAFLGSDGTVTARTFKFDWVLGVVLVASVGYTLSRMLSL